MKRYLKSIMTVGLLSLTLVNTSCIKETEPTSSVVTTDQMSRSSGVADALVKMDGIMVMLPSCTFAT